MVNQAIALQARAPQGPGLGNIIQQNAALINQMAQQRAAERQAAAQQQQLEIQRNQEARAAELHKPALAEAESKALTAQQKTVMDFYDLVTEGIKHASTPQQVAVVGNYLKNTFPDAGQVIDQALSTMPNDPAQFNAWRQQTLIQTMDAKDQLERHFQTQATPTGSRTLSMPKYGGGAATVVPGSEVNLGQEVTYVKGANGEVIPMPKRMPAGGGGLVGGPRGAGIAMGMPVAGTGKPAGGAAAGKPEKLTAQEQSASYNINRLLRGAKVIKDAVAQDPSANAPSAAEAFVGSTPLLSAAVNFTRGPQRQIVAAAQRDVLDALLYLSTGAAYNKEQLEGQMESYIPAYSDSPATVESKRQRLQQLVLDAKSRAGRGWTPELDKSVNELFAPPAASKTSKPSKAPKIGAVVDGYRFKGGDPGKQTSWEKVR